MREEGTNQDMVETLDALSQTDNLEDTDGFTIPKELKKLCANALESFYNEAYKDENSPHLAAAIDCFFHIIQCDHQEAKPKSEDEFVTFCKLLKATVSAQKKKDVLKLKHNTVVSLKDRFIKSTYSQRLLNYVHTHNRSLSLPAETYSEILQISDQLGLTQKTTDSRDTHNETTAPPLKITQSDKAASNNRQASQPSISTLLKNGILGKKKVNGETKTTTNAFVLRLPGASQQSSNTE